eukprot:5190169-Amphidinium_carterae.1
MTTCHDYLYQKSRSVQVLTFKQLSAYTRTGLLGCGRCSDVFGCLGEDVAVLCVRHCKASLMLVGCNIGAIWKRGSGRDVRSCAVQLLRCLATWQALASKLRSNILDFIRYGSVEVFGGRCSASRHTGGSDLHPGQIMCWASRWAHCSLKCTLSAG